MMTAPTLDLSNTSPAFQAGYAAGQRDARQHRRRNRVLDDISGLTAYADDMALSQAPAKNEPKQQKTRAEFIASYAEGYIQAYRLGTGA